MAFNNQNATVGQVRLERLLHTTTQMTFPIATLSYGTAPIADVRCRRTSQGQRPKESEFHS